MTRTLTVFFLLLAMALLLPGAGSAQWPHRGDLPPVERVRTAEQLAERAEGGTGLWVLAPDLSPLRLIPAAPGRISSPLQEALLRLGQNVSGPAMLTLETRTNRWNLIAVSEAPTDALEGFADDLRLDGVDWHENGRTFNGLRWGVLKDTRWGERIPLTGSPVSVLADESAGILSLSVFEQEYPHVRRRFIRHRRGYSWTGPEVAPTLHVEPSFTRALEEDGAYSLLLAGFDIPRLLENSAGTRTGTNTAVVLGGLSGLREGWLGLSLNEGRPEITGRIMREPPEIRLAENAPLTLAGRVPAEWTGMVTMNLADPHAAWERVRALLLARDYGGDSETLDRHELEFERASGVSIRGGALPLVSGPLAFACAGVETDMREWALLMELSDPDLAKRTLHHIARLTGTPLNEHRVDRIHWYSATLPETGDSLCWAIAGNVLMVTLDPIMMADLTAVALGTTDSLADRMEDDAAWNDASADASGAAIWKIHVPEGALLQNPLPVWLTMHSEPDAITLRGAAGLRLPEPQPNQEIASRP